MTPKPSCFILKAAARAVTSQQLCVFAILQATTSHMYTHRHTCTDVQ